MDERTKRVLRLARRLGGWSGGRARRYVGAPKRRFTFRFPTGLQPESVEVCSVRKFWWVTKRLSWGRTLSYIRRERQST